jgi:hypothetical protein
VLFAAGAAAAVRWGLMAFDPPLWATAILQCLHAMSFGAAHLAAIYFLSQTVPEDRGATAQGLYAAASFSGSQPLPAVLSIGHLAARPTLSWRCSLWPALAALSF